MAPADLAEEVKKSSSKWIKTKGVHYSNFYWQDGYGGFSVSNSGVDALFISPTTGLDNFC
jgi:hypothetical protein